jgi:hypothetical protein
MALTGGEAVKQWAWSRSAERKWGRTIYSYPKRSSDRVSFPEAIIGRVSAREHRVAGRRGPPVVVRRQPRVAGSGNGAVGAGQHARAGRRIAGRARFDERVPGIGVDNRAPAR